MNAALFVPGILSSGKTSIGKLIPYFERAGYLAELVGVPWGFYIIPLLTRRASARKVAARAKELADAGYTVVAVGHSNGCAIIARATEIGAPLDALVFFNAALEQSVRIGKQVRFVLNGYVPSDTVLKIAAVVPQPFWGNLGQANWKPNAAPAMWGANLTALFRARSHNDIWKDGREAMVGPWTIHALEVHTASLLSFS